MGRVHQPAPTWARGEGKQDIHIGSKFLPKIGINYKGEDSNFRVKMPEDAPLAPWSRDTAAYRPRKGRPEKGVPSHLRDSRYKCVTST